MKYKLENIDGLNTEDIKRKIDAGCTFKIFSYRISLVAISLKRLSPAFLIHNENELKTFQKKYNLITTLFGPWFIPSGPFNTYSAIRFNNKGGLDVTNDIRINLEFFNQVEKTVDIKTAYTLFTEISVDEFRELEKSISAFVLKNVNVNGLFVGKFINVSGNEELPYFIGIDSSIDKAHLIKELEELIYIRFNKFVKFHFFKREEDENLFSKIKEQGQRIK